LTFEPLHIVSPCKERDTFLFNMLQLTKLTKAAKQ
jgi:hypothetical protein